MNELETAIAIQDSDQRIEALGAFVRIGSHGRMDEEQMAIFKKSQAAILAIPGHAEYYRDRILKAREAYDTSGDDRIRFLHEWIKEQDGFRVLAQLPSVETVRILGEFLADERGKIGGPGPPPVMTEGRSMESPNCYLALSALHSLPLVNKPVAVKHANDDKDLETYRLWYAQIKSGNRTFRFEGDSTEYDLNGPAGPAKLKHINEARERDTQRATRHQAGSGAAGSGSGTESPSSSASSPASLTGILLAAGTLCLVAVWYFLRRMAAERGQ
ncbi:MAG: hypothetical protein WCP35_17750 [Verrucomicrobiota bacterium]